MSNFRTSSATVAGVSRALAGSRATSVPMLPAEYLVGHPGTSPTLRIPATYGRVADLAAAWAHLAETAEFFAVPMPTLGELRGACAPVLRRAERLPLAVVDLTVVEIDQSAQVVVTVEAVPARALPVRIRVSDDASPLARPGDPRWRRMAARTTSKAVADRLHRGFAVDGCADCIGADGVPFLGAVVFEAGGDAVGLDDPEPTSVLDQLGDCGVVTGIRRVDRMPTESERAERAWWISPRFETCPVSAIGATAYRVDGAVPAFARCA